MRTKSTPPIKDLIESKRGIIFSFNLFNSTAGMVQKHPLEIQQKSSLLNSENGMNQDDQDDVPKRSFDQNATSNPISTAMSNGLQFPMSSDRVGNMDDAADDMSVDFAKRNRTQTGDSLLSDDLMDRDLQNAEENGGLIYSASLATTTATSIPHNNQEQQEMGINHSLNTNNNNMSNHHLLSSSPLSSPGAPSKQSSMIDDDEEQDTSTDLTTTSTSSTSTSPRSGYDLSVAVHKVTSTTLLYRMHKQKQEGKYKNSPVSINPAIWSKASLSSYTNGGLASASHTSPNSASTAKHLLHSGDGPAYRKRKINQSASQAGECNWCGTKKTAQWRKGPTGARGLCNRCGIEWAKQIRHEAKRTGLPNHEAEASLANTYKESERFKRFAREHLGHLDNPIAEKAVASAALDR